MKRWENALAWGVVVAFVFACGKDEKQSSPETGQSTSTPACVANGASTPIQVTVSGLPGYLSTSLLRGYAVDGKRQDAQTLVPSGGATSGNAGGSSGGATDGQSVTLTGQGQAGADYFFVLVYGQRIVDWGTEIPYSSATCRYELTRSLGGPAE